MASDYWSLVLGDRTARDVRQEACQDCESVQQWVRDAVTYVGIDRADERNALRTILGEMATR